jgi:hypothetical protein
MTETHGTEQGLPQPPLQQAPPDKDARTWGAICHLAAMVVLLCIPFGNVLGPLVVWLMKRNDHPFIDQQGKSALNFQISVAIYSVGVFILLLPLIIFVVGIFIAVPLLLAIVVVDLILVILAAVKAHDGQTFKYPLTIKFIK